MNPLGCIKGSIKGCIFGKGCVLILVIPCLLALILLYPNSRKKAWHADLPACPCTYEKVKQLADNNTDTKGTWKNYGEASTTYHYGATYEFRWVPKKRGPGQQCTYDEKKKLITGGLAAGSPDKASPQNIGVLAHVVKDVYTWYKLPAVQYLKEWPANNVGGYKTNIVSGIDHMLGLVGKMTAPEIVELIKNAKENKYNISEDLRKYILGENNTLSKEKVSEDLKTWKANTSYEWFKPENWWSIYKLRNSTDEAIANLQNTK